MPLPRLSVLDQSVGRAGRPQQESIQASVDLAVARGGRAETLMGLSGLGDLVLAEVHDRLAAGFLVAAGLHPSPVPYADVVSTTVHKTLAGPRSGLILCKAEYAKKIDSAVFPGQQGGPLMHVIAAKATAFKAAMTDEFKDRQNRTIEGAAIIANRLAQADMAEAGVQVLTGSTKVHLVLVDLRNSPIDGMQAENLLHEVGITVNRNSVPNDPRPPMTTSGVRIGTPALATRGFGAAEFTEVAEVIASVLKPNPDIASLRARTKALADKFPLYSGLENW